MRRRTFHPWDLRALIPVVFIVGFASGVPGGIVPPDHVVVLIEENHDYNQIIGSSDAPYLNHLADTGLSFLNSHSQALNSFVNYMDLFSGSDQGASDESDTRFPTPNLGSSLQSVGRTFVGYSDSMPADGFTGEDAPLYVRRHNPWTQFSNLFVNGSNAAINKVFNATNFPTAAGTDYKFLPDVSFVVPNLLNDMHGDPSAPLSDSQLIARGDAWVQNNLGSYIQWAQTHRSLLIVTWDENDYVGTLNHIPTLVTGDPSLVHPGLSGQPVNHFSLLRTLENWYGLPALGGSATADPFATDATGALVPHPALLLGDATGDGVVNFADLLVVARNYGRSSMTFSEGDFNADGSVDFSDLVTLARQYGKTLSPAPASAAVPEPAMGILMLPLGFAFLRRSRRATSTKTTPAR